MVLEFKILSLNKDLVLKLTIKKRKNKKKRQKKEISSVAFDGNASVEDVIKAYNRANEIKFEADKALFQTK